VTIVFMPGESAGLVLDRSFGLVEFSKECVGGLLRPRRVPIRSVPNRLGNPRAVDVDQVEQLLGLLAVFAHAWVVAGLDVHALDERQALRQLLTVVNDRGNDQRMSPSSNRSSFAAEHVPHLLHAPYAVEEGSGP
jgi:hypothetical protein